MIGTLRPPFEVAAAPEHHLPYEEELCGKQAPSQHDMREQIVKPHVRPKIRREWNEHPITVQVVQLLTRCWDQDPTLRLSASAFKTRLDAIYAQLQLDHSPKPFARPAAAAAADWPAPAPSHSQPPLHSTQPDGSASDSKWSDSNGSKSYYMGSTSDSSQTTLPPPNPAFGSGNNIQFQSIHTLDAPHLAAAVAHSTVSQSHSSSGSTITHAAQPQTQTQSQCQSESVPVPPAVPITSELFEQIRELLLRSHVTVPADLRQLALAACASDPQQPLPQQTLALRLVRTPAPESANATTTPTPTTADHQTSAASTALRPPAEFYGAPADQQQLQMQRAPPPNSNSVRTSSETASYKSASGTPTRELSAAAAAAQRSAAAAFRAPPSPNDHTPRSTPSSTFSNALDAAAAAVTPLLASHSHETQQRGAPGVSPVGSKNVSVAGRPSVPAAARAGGDSHALALEELESSTSSAGVWNSERHPLIGVARLELQNDPEP